MASTTRKKAPMAARKTAPKTTSHEAQPESGVADRVKRPELPRTEPIRSWTALFGADSGAARAQAAYAAGARTTSEAVQRGVELGYRVVDEYLRQGSTAADAFTGRGRQQALPGAEFSQMAERMMRSAQDFTSLWFEMMGSFMANMPAPGPNGQHAAHAPERAARGAPSSAAEPAASDAGRWRVVVRIESTRPTEVTVSMDEAIQTPMVESLRSALGSAHIDASLEVVEDSARVVRLWARVPAGLPADRYTGAVLDAATGRPGGRVTIAILE